MPIRSFCPLLPAAALVLLASPAPPAAADAPKVSSLFPGGARRGETVRIEAKGTFKPWPVAAWVDRPGVDFTPEEEPGVFSVAVRPEATPGVARVRFHDAEGAEALRPFLIGTLPEVAEVEPNEADEQAQAIEGPAAVVNGRLEKSGDVDAFAVTLEAGQTLVASLEANRRLGAPMDGVLQVVSPEGFVVDHADDSPFLDPALTFTAPSAGTYVVRVFAFPSEPNSTIGFAGGDEYVYRLTLSTGGVVELAHPSAVTSGDCPELAPVGRNLPEDPAPLSVEAGPTGGLVAWRDDLAGFAEVEVVDLPVITDPDEDAGPIDLPAVICGRVAAEGEVASIAVRAPAGRSIAVRVAARSFGSPLDGVLRILDASGEQLAESDDSRRSPDPEATVTVPEDGALHLLLRDLHGRGGPGFVYRIEAREPEPGFELTVDSDRFALSTGKTLEIAVAVDRRDSEDRPISVSAEGLPEGVAIEEAVSEPEGDSSKKVTLRLSGAEAVGWSGPIRLVGLPEGGDGAGPRPATAAAIGGSRTDLLWLTVVPE